MDKTAVVKVGAVASVSVCALFGGVVLAQYIVAKKKRAGKKTKIIEMVSFRSSVMRMRIENGWPPNASLRTTEVCYIGYKWIGHIHPL